MQRFLAFYVLFEQIYSMRRHVLSLKIDRTRASTELFVLYDDMTEQNSVCVDYDRTCKDMS